MSCPDGSAVSGWYNLPGILGFFLKSNSLLVLGILCQVLVT